MKNIVLFIWSEEKAIPNKIAKLVIKVVNFFRAIKAYHIWG